MNYTINISEIESIKRDRLVDSKLVILLSNNPNISIVAATLRTIAFDFIPTYRFCSNSIKIIQNTSIFNNDKMRLRLSQMPIYLSPSDKVINHLKSKYWHKPEFNFIKTNKHKKDNLEITMVIKITNANNDVLNVTTNDAKFYKNNIEFEPFDKNYPHLLIQLRREETFDAICNTVLSVGHVNNIWSSVANCYFDTSDDLNYTFTLLSNGDFTEYLILYKCCIFIIKELEFFNEIIKNNVDNTKKGIRLELDMMNFIGCLVNAFLQDHPNINFSGVSRSNYLQEDCILTIYSESHEVFKSLFEVIENLIGLFDNLRNQFADLGKLEF